MNITTTEKLAVIKHLACQIVNADIMGLPERNKMLGEASRIVELINSIPKGELSEYQQGAKA